MSAVRRTETFPTGDVRCSVTVTMASGQIEVRAFEAQHVGVDLESHHADLWEISRFGDTVAIHAPRRRSGKSARLSLQVPSGTHLRIDAASADMVMHGSLGDVRVRTASGDLRADDVERIDFGSASGDVKVRTVNGRLVASTASGDVRADRVGDDCQCGTASGDVRIDCCDGDAIEVKTVSGNILLGLPAGIRVDPDIATLSGRTRMPTPRAAPPVDAPRRNVRVRLRAVSGDITIERVDR